MSPGGGGEVQLDSGSASLIDGLHAWLLTTGPLVQLYGVVERQTSSGTVSIVERSLDVLEMLVRSEAPRSLSEIVEAVGGAKATVHRLLKTLQARQYVIQDPRTARYTAGIRCFELGNLCGQNRDLRSVAAPFLRQLNDEVGETVHLAVYDYGDVVYIDRIESPQPVVARSHIGDRCPASCVATGRALLAFEPKGEISRVLGGPLPAFTKYSVSDPAELDRVLRRVRTDGFAVNHSSFRDGVGGVAAPIRDYTGRVVASVGLCLPESRFGSDRLEFLRTSTTHIASAISASLGGPDMLNTGISSGDAMRGSLA